MKNPKVSEIGKALGGIASKEIINIMAEYGIALKSHAAVMEDRYLDILLTYYTRKYEVEDLSVLFSSAEKALFMMENVFGLVQLSGSR